MGAGEATYSNYRLSIQEENSGFELDLRIEWNLRLMVAYKDSLRLPSLLLALLDQNRWRHPGDEVIMKIIPFLREPVDFLKPQQLAWRESHCFLADDPRLSTVFHEVRGSQSSQLVVLPWLDIEQAISIAENRFPGDDLGIFLDYRTSQVDPRVVASDWWSSSDGCLW